MRHNYSNECIGRTVRAVVIACGIAAAMVAAACDGGQSGALPIPVAPTPLPPAITSYAGVWHGQFTITQCRGRRHCNQSIGQRSAFVLRLQQSGPRVEGVFQAETFAVAVQGAVSVDGALSLTGSRASPSPYSPAVELTRFTAQQSSTTTLVADLAYELRYPETMPENNNAREQSIAGRVASAERGKHTPINSFAGRWVGWFVISECSTEGWTYCWPEELGREYPYELTLTQVEDRVTGELRFRRRVNVTGTIAGDALTLDPVTLEEPVSSARSLTHLQRWTMTRDGVGQVRGDLSYVLETLWAPSLQRPPYVSRYRGQIVYGILEP